jgi:hypothetical protein
MATEIRRSWVRTGSVDETLALSAASLREIKQHILPRFNQERVATDAGLFLEGLLGDEQRKTGWMRAEAACTPGPWRQQAIRSRWNATGESFLDVAMQREQPQKDDSQAVSDWRNVGLIPLAAPEGDQSLRGQVGIQEPRHRLTISTNATRRTTLSGHRTSSNLARIGQFTTHIQSHGEQVETNFTNKSKPRGRKEKAELSAERAQEGRRVWRGRPCLSANLRSQVWDPTIPRARTLHCMPAAF